MSNYDEEVKILRKHVSGRVQHLVGLFGKKPGTESERQTSDPSKVAKTRKIIERSQSKLQTHFIEKKNELESKRSTSTKEEAGKNSYKAVPSHDPVYQRAVRLRSEQRSAELEAKASLLKFTQSAKSRVDTHAEELRRQEQRYREQEAAAKRSLEKNTGGAVFSQDYMKAKEIATYSKQKEREAKKALQQFHHYDYSHKIIHVNGIAVPRDPDEHYQYFPPQKYIFLSSPQIRSASTASASRALESFVGGLSEEESKKQNDAVYGKNLEIHSPIALKTDNANVVGGNYLWENERKSYTLCSPRSSEERSRFSFDSVPLSDAEEKEKVDGTIRTRSRKKSDVRSLYELQITQTMRRGTIHLKSGNGSEVRTLKDEKAEIQEVAIAKEEGLLVVDDAHVDEESGRCEDADDKEERMMKTEECVSIFKSVVTSTESTAFGSEDEVIGRDEEVEEGTAAEIQTAQRTLASDVVIEEVEVVGNDQWNDGKSKEGHASEMETESNETQMEQSTCTSSHKRYSESYSYEEITTTTSVSKVSSFTQKESVMADDVQSSQVESAFVSEAVREAAMFSHRENVDSIAMGTHSEDFEGIIKETEESKCDSEDREMEENSALQMKDSIAENDESTAPQSVEVEGVDRVSATIDASFIEKAAGIEARLDLITNANGKSIEAEEESIRALKEAEATESVREAKDVVETEKVEGRGGNASVSDAEFDGKIVAISWHMEHILKEAINFMDFKYGNRKSVQASTIVFESNALSIATDGTAASDELTEIEYEIEVKTTASSGIIDKNVKEGERNALERGTLTMAEDVKGEEDVIDVTRNGFVGVSWYMSRILETTVKYMEMKVTLESESFDVEDGITEKRLDGSAERGTSSDVEEMDLKDVKEEGHSESEIEIVKDVCHVGETNALKAMEEGVSGNSMAMDDRAITASWHMQHILKETIKYMELKYSVDAHKSTLLSRTNDFSDAADEMESDERTAAENESEDEMETQFDDTFDEAEAETKVIEVDTKESVIMRERSEEVLHTFGAIQLDVKSLDMSTGSEMEAISIVHANENVSIEEADSEMIKRQKESKEETFVGVSWHMSQIVEITLEDMERRVTMESESIGVEEVTTEKQLKLLAVDDTKAFSVDVESNSEKEAVTREEDELVQIQFESESDNVSKIGDQASIKNEADVEAESMAIDRAITASSYMQHILGETIKYMELKFSGDTQESTLLSETNEFSDIVDVTSDEIDGDATQIRNVAESSAVALQEDNWANVSIAPQSDDNEEAESNVVFDSDVGNVSRLMDGLLEDSLVDSKEHGKTELEVSKTKEDVAEVTKDEFVGVSWHMAQILEVTVASMDMEGSEAVHKDNEQGSPLNDSVLKSIVEHRLIGISQDEKAVKDAEEGDANDMEDVAYSVTHSSTLIVNDDMDPENASEKSEEEEDSLNDSQLAEIIAQEGEEGVSIETLEDLAADKKGREGKDSSDDTLTTESEFIGVSWRMESILKTAVEFLESKRIDKETRDINKAFTEEIAASDEPFEIESHTLDHVSAVNEIVLEEIESTENISTFTSTIVEETTESVADCTTEISVVESVETSQFVAEEIGSNTVVDKEAEMTFEGVSWHMEHILQRTLRSMNVENVTERQNDVQEVDNVEDAESEQLVEECVKASQFVSEEVEEMTKLDFDGMDEVVVSDHSDASETEAQGNVADELLVRDISSGAYMPTILSTTIDFMKAWTRKDIQMEASDSETKRKGSEAPHISLQTEEVPKIDDSPSFDVTEDAKSEEALGVEIEAERLEADERRLRTTHSMDVNAFGEALKSNTETVSVRDRTQSEKALSSGHFESDSTGEAMQAEGMRFAYGSNETESFEYESIAVETVTTSVTTVTTTNWETKEDTSDDDRHSSPAVAVFLDEMIERIDGDESSESAHTEMHSVREIAQEFVQSLWHEVIHAVSVRSIDTEEIVHVSGDEELTNATKLVACDNRNGSGSGEEIISSINEGLTTQGAMFAYEHSELEHVTIDAKSSRTEEIVERESAQFSEYEETTTTITSVSKTICQTAEFEQMKESNRFTELSSETDDPDAQISCRMTEGEKTEIPESVASEMVSRIVEELVDDSIRMSQDTFDDEADTTSDALETGNTEENVSKAVGPERMEERPETVVVADEMSDTPSDTSDSTEESHVDVASGVVDEIVTIVQDEMQVDAETPSELASVGSLDSNVISNEDTSSHEIDSHTEIETEESMTVAKLETVSSELIHSIVDNISDTESDTKSVNHPADHETLSESFDQKVEKGSLHSSETQVVSQRIVTMETTTSVQHTSIRSISSVSTTEMNEDATLSNVSSTLQGTTSFSSEQLTQSDTLTTEITETLASAVHEKTIATGEDEADDDEAGVATNQNSTPRKSSLDGESNDKPIFSQSRGSFGSFLNSFNLLGSSGRRRSQPIEKEQTEPIRMSNDAEASVVAISDIDSEEYHDSKDEQDPCEKEKLEYQELPSARDSIERGSFSSFEGSSSGIGGLSSPIPQNLSTFHDPTPASVADFLMETQAREQRPLMQDDLRTLDTHEDVEAVESSEAKVSEGSRDNIPVDEESSEAVESKSASKSRFGSFRSSSIAKKFGWKRASGSKDTQSSPSHGGSREIKKVITVKPFGDSVE